MVGENPTDHESDERTRLPACLNAANVRNHSTRAQAGCQTLIKVDFILHSLLTIPGYGSVPSLTTTTATTLIVLVPFQVVIEIGSQ